jgi:hypothetical protein
MSKYTDALIINGIKSKIKRRLETVSAKWGDFISRASIEQCMILDEQIPLVLCKIKRDLMDDVYMRINEIEKKRKLSQETQDNE